MESLQSRQNPTKETEMTQTDIPPTVDFRQVRAPRGTAMTCKGWQQEAALRLMQNNLEVGERPQDLVIYGEGRVARNLDCYLAIIEAFRSLENDETLLIQSGKPV